MEKKPVEFKHFPTLESSQTWLFQQKQNLSSESFHIILCDQQTKGLGQHGRTWDSPPGNLYVSYGFFLSHLALDQLLMRSMEIAWLWIDILKDILPPHVYARLAIKWPNDLLLDRKKVGGSLIQWEEDGGQFFMVFGCGLNIKTPPRQTAGLQSGTCLSHYAPLFYDRRALALAMGERLQDTLKRSPCGEVLRKRIQNKMAFIGDLIAFKDHLQGYVVGYSQGIDLKGRLGIQALSSAHTQWFSQGSIQRVFT